MYAHPFVLLNSWTLRCDCPLARLKCVFLDTWWLCFHEVYSCPYLPHRQPWALTSVHLSQQLISINPNPSSEKGSKTKTKQNKTVRVSFLKPWLLGEAAGCGTVFSLRSHSLPHFFLVFPVLSNPVTRCCLTLSPPCYWIVSDFHLLFSPGYCSSTCCFSLGYSSSKLNDSTPD